MAHWLFKEEPTHYAFADLERDGRTQWSGIHNALALRHLKSCRVADTGFYYHTGKERAIVGIFRVRRGPRPDPSDARGSWSLEIAPVRSLRAPISLGTLRSDPQLRGFDLLRITRLSVVPVSEPIWRRVLSHEPARSAGSTAD